MSMLTNLVVHAKVFWVKRFTKGEFFRMPDDRKIDETVFNLDHKLLLGILTLESAENVPQKFKAAMS